jgi:hypothetical protein
MRDEHSEKRHIILKKKKELIVRVEWVNDNTKVQTEAFFISKTSKIYVCFMGVPAQKDL